MAWVSGSAPAAGPVIGLVGRDARRALEVVVAVRREVAVRVDAVAARDLAVGVVVAQVLAPESVARGEGEVVAVGVGHRQEPQLRLLSRFGSAGALVRHHVLTQQPQGVDLGRDPLTGVLGGGVEDRRFDPVGQDPGELWSP